MAKTKRPTDPAPIEEIRRRVALLRFGNNPPKASRADEQLDSRLSELKAAFSAGDIASTARRHQGGTLAPGAGRMGPSTGRATAGQEGDCREGS